MTKGWCASYESSELFISMSKSSLAGYYIMETAKKNNTN